MLQLAAGLERAMDGSRVRTTEASATDHPLRDGAAATGGAGSVADPVRRADALSMERFAAGDRAAARDLTERFLPLCYRLAYRLLSVPAEAEDVAQEAMMRLFAKAPDWQGERARISTWLYRVTANLATDRLRARPTLPIEAADAVPAPGPGPEAALTDRARLLALQAALDGLPERQRLAIVLSQIEGLAQAEVAQVMGCGIEAVESLVARGKKGLAAALGPQRGALGFGGEDE